MTDLIIPLSPTQKYLRVEKLRRELSEMGFSVVPTEWVQEQTWKKKVAEVMEAAE